MRDKVISEIRSNLSVLGGHIKLDRPIKFKETPHTPVVWINELSLEDSFEEMGNEINTINQRLKLIIHENSKNKPANRD